MFGMKVLFLDIDGVLNSHIMHDLSDCAIMKKSCVDELNKIIHQTDCYVVISSAWRYIILAQNMTLGGFEYMLRSHGVTSKLHILGITLPDENVALRSGQIQSWIASYNINPNPAKPPLTHYCIVDDNDFGFTKDGMTFVKTDPHEGLTEVESSQIIEILNK